MITVSNPILPGFHPDPSILRVGDTYYIANSTFEWYPGVEIHRSKDLASWEQLPSPLSEKRLLDMLGNPASGGIWAPCLSYSDGLFYLVFTNVQSWNSGPWKDAPNYLTTAPSIEGPWSDPVFLNASGFDASLFHDDDGRKWLVNMEWDYRKTNVAWQFTGILLQEYDCKEKKLVGKVKNIFTGTAIKLVEGPHLYKKNDWYYLLTAEGGTQYEHAATLARSKTIDGPYEVHPTNPLLTSYGRTDLYLQKAGHASWCDTPNGKTYLAFLCGRPLPGTKHCVLGRETALTELEWHSDGWPYVKYADLNGTDKPRSVFGESIPNFPGASFAPPEPLAELPKPYSVLKNYRFDTNSIDRDFKTLRTAPDTEFYSLNARKGFLRLRGGQSPVSRFKQTLLARRQLDFSFASETYMEFEPKSFHELAGLSWRYDENNQYLLALSYDEQKGRVLSVHSMIAGVYSRTDDTALSKDGGIWLGLTVHGTTGRFRYSLDGNVWNTLRPVLDAAVLSDEYYQEGFTGAFIGMFCIDTANYAAHADFKCFMYTPLTEELQ
ncbi:glycoside hydrolase family 43 protein [Treponema primitia]|uniref:glycoside hydrolase family 43 protein n=1 Tax=Treponema primitia TaxID=88058 RepID=UPI0002554DF4|nr:glycoside hydrolase family 43 protein [Treponema primitia]